MELPALPFKIPEIPLPFDIPVLMHPPVDHFVIALPVVVLLLEIINLFVKKRAIGVISFFLLILTVAAAVAAYLTGSVDGKQAWDLLSQAGQADLKAHKMLGTYLMLASGVVLVFKLLSAMINRGLMKALYIFVLIFFVVGILKQGKEGGELVYEFGANVKVVKTMDDKIFELQDELNDYIAEEKEAEEEAKKAEEVKKAEEAKSTAAVTEEKPETVPAEKTESAKEETPAAEVEMPAVESETSVPETPAAETAESAPADDTATESISPASTEAGAEESVH